MFVDNSLWEGFSDACQLSETIKWSGVIKFLTPINLIEPFIVILDINLLIVVLLNMDFDEFKNLYALTMMSYQRIEYDIKLIYAYMLRGDADNNLENIENKTLGMMVRILEELDYSDSKPFISKADYQFLKDICDKRNYYAHQVFIDFIYKDSPLSSNEYRDISALLENDYKEVIRASDILEEMRIECCDKYRG